MQYDQAEDPFSILIASGNPQTRESVAAIFSDCGYRTTLAADGAEAFEKAKSAHFDLVIASVTMARLDGMELLGALRQLDPDRPVILITEGASEIENVYLRCAALMGAARTFQQPLDPLTFRRNARAVILQSKLRIKV